MATKCKVDGCDRNISSKKTGFCHMHNLRFIRTGATISNKVDRTKKCCADGCNRNVQTKKHGDFCLLHHKRFEKYGTVKLPISQKKNTCKFCNRKIGDGGAVGMCASHYRSYKLYGDPLEVERRKQKPGCRGYKPRRNGKDEHKIVMENKIGRKLKRGEIIHHINLDKLDNREENLHLCKTQSEHSFLHRELERCGAELLKCGYIRFEDGKYIVNI